MLDALVCYAAVTSDDQGMKQLISLLVFPLGVTFSKVTFAQKAETTCEYCWILDKTKKTKDFVS
jgi:hypothetical protein